MWGTSSKTTVLSCYNEKFRVVPSMNATLSCEDGINLVFS
jgi:hypothetical protein